jgi:hypothetical protein
MGCAISMSRLGTGWASRSDASVASCTTRSAKTICSPGKSESSSKASKNNSHAEIYPLSDCQSSVDAPIDARCFLKVWHVIRCCRVSGLMMRQFTRRGPVWRSADRVQIGVARSRRSD